MSGTAINSAREWRNKRRPELKELFQHYMYGDLPAKPDHIEFKTVSHHPDFLEGLGTLRIITIECGRQDPTRISLMLVTPNQVKGRVPAFLAMNFCGNHTVSDDPRIPLTEGWLYKSCVGCQDNHATAAARGTQKQDWPIAEILRRGYAFATFCTTDIDSDRGDVSDGVRAREDRAAGRLVEAANRGTIAAWAWGFHRCMDYLETDRHIDRKHIAAVGHSRNGKTALLAAALDERIALAIPHQAGCGGTAPSRGTIGESIQRINTAFPHWFNARFKQFTNDTARLPFDQHCLVALMAPRPVLLSNAEEDQWANPAGQFDVLRAAEPVYKLLNAGRLDVTNQPANGVLLRSRLGYYIRPGKHSMTAGDWNVFMDYADAHFR
jgi:dienelactone hydrolase